MAVKAAHTWPHHVGGDAPAEKTPAEIDERAEDHINRDTGQDYADGGAAAPCRKNRHENEPRPERHGEPLRDAGEIAAFPRRQLAKRHQDKQRDEQRYESEIEERRTDRDFFATHGFERQRIEGADENRGAAGRQKQIVEDDGALARDGREEAALLQPACPQSEESKRAADEDYQNEEYKDPPRGIAREGMDRRQYAGANQKGSDKRQRKGEDGKEDRPDFEGFPLFHHRCAMQQRGGREPWHHRGVLER